MMMHTTESRYRGRNTHHDLASGVVGNSRRLGGQVGQLQSFGQAQDRHGPLLGDLGELQQTLAHVLREANGDVAEGFHATYEERGGNVSGYST